MGKTDRRQRKTGGLYQRCEPKRGCPPMVDGERPDHKCKGSWVAAVTLPPGPNGKRRRKVIVRAKYVDAQKELNKLRDKAERAGDLPTSSPTLSGWIDAWWERYALPDLKVSTRDSYRSKIEQYIRPAIGHIKLDHFGIIHVHRLREFITKDKGLSSTTARQAFAILSSILSAAETEGKISRNPCDLLDAPSKRRHKVEHLSSAQARDLLAINDPGDGTIPMDLAMAATALLVGPRPGERLGLTRDEIDLETGTLTVAWQLQRLTFDHGCGEPTAEGWPCARKRGGNCPQRHLDIPDNQEIRHVEGGLYLTRPKTSAGWREFTMPPLLRETLAAYLENHEPGMFGLIFTRDGGRPIDPSDDSRWWDGLLRGADMPDVDRHSARHTCNTILTELGYPVDVRQKIIGHASRAVNEEVYTHTSDARVTEATAALGAAMDWRTS